MMETEIDWRWMAVAKLVAIALLLEKGCLMDDRGVGCSDYTEVSCGYSHVELHWSRFISSTLDSIRHICGHHKRNNGIQVHTGYAFTCGECFDAQRYFESRRSSELQCICQVSCYAPQTPNTKRSKCCYTNNAKMQVNNTRHTKSVA